MQDIHDIRPPVMVGIDPQLLGQAAWAVAGLILLLGVIYLARKFWKKRSSRQEMEVTPAIPPFDAAQEQLDQLARTPGLSRRAFYFKLGEILKTYLGESLGFHAREMTTPELKRALALTPLGPELTGRISRFQEGGDPIRYAPDSVPDGGLGASTGKGNLSDPTRPPENQVTDPNTMADVTSVRDMIQDVESALSPRDDAAMADRSSADADFGPGRLPGQRVSESPGPGLPHHGTKAGNRRNP